MFETLINPNVIFNIRLLPRIDRFHVTYITAAAHASTQEQKHFNQTILLCASIWWFLSMLKLAGKIMKELPLITEY